LGNVDLEKVGDEEKNIMCILVRLISEEGIDKTNSTSCPTAAFSNSENKL
jgi:hypothetical protein